MECVVIIVKVDNTASYLTSNASDNRSYVIY